MGITVAVQLDDLVLPKVLTTTTSQPSGLVLIPNLEPHESIRDSVKNFIRQNFFIEAHLQVLVGPLFRKLDETENVENVYKQYSCHADNETSDLHLDEDTCTFFAREGGRVVELDDSLKLQDYHILDKTVLQLRTLPGRLPEEGGRVFVETKDGILPVLGVTPDTHVLELKHALERMTDIPVDKQLLSSVGRIMHDEFFMKDFEGLHRVCKDSILDLCKSGDTNAEQGHKRMVVYVKVMGEQTFTIVVQGRDSVESVLRVVESRTGIAAWQQRITFSGKVLQEKKRLGDYHIHPDCRLQVTVFRSPSKASQKLNNNMHSEENSEVENRPAARKIKLLRFSKGRVNGSITIPVLTSDTISDLRRKVRRTLQPLIERNSTVGQSPSESNVTPKKASPLSGKGGDGGSGRRLSRMLSFTGRSVLNQQNMTSPLASANSSAAPSPRSSKKGSASKAAASPRVISLKNFSGPLLSMSGKTEHQTGSLGSHNSDSTGKPGKDVPDKPAAARVLKFNNFSGPLVFSPSKTGELTATPLFPLPPRSSTIASPAKPFGNNGVNRATGEKQLSSAEKVKTSRNRTGENEQPTEASTPLKFVYMRQVPDATSACPGLSRNASVSSMPFSPTGLYSRSESSVPESIADEKPGGDSTPKLQTAGGKGSSTSTPSSERKGISAWFTDSIQTLRSIYEYPSRKGNAGRIIQTDQSAEERMSERNVYLG